MLLRAGLIICVGDGDNMDENTEMRAMSGERQVQ